MDKLKSLPRFLIFHEVAKKESFTLASHQLGLTKSAISQHISKLESSLQVQLINRTTRGLKLTEAGKRFLDHCIKIDQQMELALEEIQDIDQSPRGVLTITAPHSLEQTVVMPTLTEYCLGFPDLKPHIIIDDKPLDLISNNIDIALHIGQLKDSSYRARRLGQIEDIICASPKYLDKRPPILSISDLGKHNWVATTWQQMQPRCKLTRNAKLHSHDSETFSVPQDIKANTLPAAISLVEKGFGLGMLPDICTQQALRDGSIVRVLPDVLCTLWPVHAVHPYHGKVPNKVKCFIDIAQKYIAQHQSSTDLVADCA